MNLSEIIDQLNDFYLRYGDMPTVGDTTFVGDPNNPRFSVNVQSYKKRSVVRKGGEE